MNQKIRMVTIVAALGASCAQPEDTPNYREDLNDITVVDPATCIDPRNSPHPATLNDASDDDRLGIQEAIDLAKTTGRPVCLAPGRFDVAIDNQYGGGHIESLKIWNSDGLAIVGAGSRSVIAFKGTGIRRDPLHKEVWQPGDWWLFGVRGARDTYFGYFKIDGSPRRETEEQTHAIQLTHLPVNFDGNAVALSTSNTQIDHVDFYDPAPQIPAGLERCFNDDLPETTMCLHPNHPDGNGNTNPVHCEDIPGSGYCSVEADGTRTVVGFYGGGDCIRLLAEQAVAKVIDTTIEGSHAVCDRSFVGLQRGTDGYRVLDNTVDAVGGQAIDEEPTGTGSAYRAYIAGNTFHRGGGRKMGTMITMTGTTRENESTENVITANVLDGSIMTYDASNTVVSFNTIGIAEGGDAPIYMIKYGAGNRILGNTIVREHDADSGSGIVISAHNNGSPSDFIISGNVIRIHSEGNGIVAEPAVGVLVANNVIESTTTTAPTYSAFTTRGTHYEGHPWTTFDDVTTSVDRVTFTGNQVRGNFLRMFIERQFAIPAVPAGVMPNGTPYPGRPSVPIPNYSTVVTGNIYEPAVDPGNTTHYGVHFFAGCPTPTPVIDANIFRGVTAANQVLGACGTAWVGQNSGP